MMLKTHLVVCFAFLLFLIDKVANEFLFLIVGMFATLLPDIDCVSSYLGNRWYVRPVQWFTSHRGLLHSLSFCIFLSLIVSLFLPKLAFPFFLGYGIHLLLDSFTVEGIRPFWPIKSEVSGLVSSGGSVDEGVFICFSLISIILVIGLFT